jgi:uracil-DNA glycosylase
MHYVVTSEADRAVMAVTIDPDFWRGRLCFVGLRPEKETRHRQRMPLRGYLGQRFRGSNHIRRPRQACRTKCG